MKNQNIMFTRIVPKMSKARLFRSVLALGIAALIMQVSLPRAQAYDLSSLNGSYADSFSGFHPVGDRPPGGPNPPHPVPINSFGVMYDVGLYRFDGAGGFTARAAFNFSGGHIVNADWSLNPLFTGTYSVNADGTGTMFLPFEHRYNFVIGAGGNELKYIATDPDTGIITSGSMVKQ